MAHDVFVSYSQHDKPVADAVVANLEQEGVRCWIAPRDITPGTSWGEAIVEAIEGSRVMVLVLSANSNSSRQVVREVERAVACNVVILPFRIENIDPTGAMAYFLGTEHWLDALTPPLEHHIARLVHNVAVLLERPAPPVPPAPPPPAPAAATSRTPVWLYAGIAGVVAISAVIIAAILSGGGGGSSTTTELAATTVTESTSSTSTATTTTTTTTTTIPVVLSEVGEYQPIDLDLTDTRTPGPITGFDIEGSFLAFSQGIDGVTLVSIGDPTFPRPMSTFHVDDAQVVAFDGEWMYAISGEFAPEMSAFDTDGVGPAPLQFESGATQSIYHAEVADGYVYVSGHDYVGIVDVTDHQRHKVVYEWEPPGNTGNPANTFVADGIGYFSAGWDGLYLFDVSDPASPAALGHWPSPNWIIDLVVVDGLAYATLGDTGLAIVDVSDPASPELLGLAELPGFAGDVVVGHGHAFVSWAGEGGSLGGIAVVDVRDAESPEFLETFGRFQTVNGLGIVGDHIYVAEQSRGLLVFEISGIE